ncbi:uncharacterized protein BDCG_01468 [Blastomyces dermatitidis ER-3]|uniref:Uncharacterized protein n=1 Tax=Ajellomyces dermatitidis (strain ER-3 / ATCC MYA-2586) TaxID=559297 RepID=A0ABP2ERN0_AJEDR|nr:uncharacterized protein BDCG_01468 [Blastomyces dermatitidis ER-3]EEQ86348.1 hypothetical protein BDCG_01468 [Blastomyces dermatitidis ER-3]
MVVDGVGGGGSSVCLGWLVLVCSQDGMRKRAQRRRRDRIPVVRPVRKKGQPGGAASIWRRVSGGDLLLFGLQEPLLSSSLAALPGADTSIITEFRGLHRICPPPIPDMTGLNYGHTIATRTY